MPLLWKRHDGEDGNITPPHAFTSREGVISVLLYLIEKCILPYKGERYALFEQIPLKNTRVFKIFPRKHDVLWSFIEKP